MSKTWETGNGEKPGKSGTLADNKSDKNNDKADETGTETFTVKKTWKYCIIITHFEQIKTA